MPPRDPVSMERGKNRIKRYRKGIGHTTDRCKLTDLQDKLKALTDLQDKLQTLIDLQDKLQAGVGSDIIGQTTHEPVMGIPEKPNFVLSPRRSLSVCSGLRHTGSRMNPCLYLWGEGEREREREREKEREGEREGGRERGRESIVS